MDEALDKPLGGNPVAKTVFVAVVALAWVFIDQWTKALFENCVVGEYYGSAFGGLVNFRLVHNTGAAWGVFSGNSSALGIFSLAVCLALLGYFIVNVRSINFVQCLGIALIIAGGFGNAIDRFTQGYVVDFIAVTFVDFPIFNVADIGVTCGVGILIIGLIVAWVSDSKDGN